MFEKNIVKWLFLGRIKKNGPYAMWLSYAFFEMKYPLYICFLGHINIALL